MKKTNTLFSPVTALLIVVFCGSSIPAQQENPVPSLQETMNWIKGKLLDVTSPSCVNDSIAMVDKTTSVSVNASTLMFTETVRDDKGQYNEQRDGDRYTINFADINPDSVKVKEFSNCGGRGYVVNLETSSGEKKIRFEYSPESARLNPPRLLSSVGLTISDEDLAQRLAKAVKHAVILSGGKPGIF